jgi:hypothetical protein
MNCPLCHRQLVQHVTGTSYCPYDKNPALEHATWRISPTHYNVSERGSISIYTGNYCLVKHPDNKDHYYLYRWEGKGWSGSTLIPFFQFKDEDHLIKKLKTILVFG